MSKIEVDTIAPQSGTQVTLGESGDTITIPTGVTLDASNATTTGFSSAEVYGFSKNSSGQLIITTTNGGADNISAATYATFDDVLFAASGFTWSISGANLIATI
jgi:hypothetical protein